MLQHDKFEEHVGRRQERGISNFAAAIVLRHCFVNRFNISSFHVRCVCICFVCMCCRCIIAIVVWLMLAGVTDIVNSDASVLVRCALQISSS